MTHKVQPGFSSRSSIHVVKQFPQRDEAAMSEHHPEPGFSNSEAVEAAPQDVVPDVQVPDQPEPGFSNDLAIVAEDGPEVVEKPVEDEEPEPERPAKKAAAKKSTAKKRG